MLFDGQPRWDQFSRVNETLNVTNTGHPPQWFINWWWIRLGMATEDVLSPLLELPKQASCTARDPRILRSGLMNLGCQIEEPTNQQNYQGVPDIQLGIQFRNFTLSVLRWTPGTSALW